MRTHYSQLEGKGQLTAAVAFQFTPWHSCYFFMEIMYVHFLHVHR